MAPRIKIGRAPVLLLSLAVAAILSPAAYALREGGLGNAPIRNPNWPQGAAAVYNAPSRIAYWHGPMPGEWHADCRGDVKALNAVLEDFAKLDVKNKRVVVHDGIGNSEWINISNDPARRGAAKMDWTFLVWDPADWARFHNRRINPGPNDAAGPPAQIDIYTGGNIKWSEVVVPGGLVINDLRLEAHGFTLADGLVLEGKVTDLATDKPIAAKVRLERMQPKREGGFVYETIAQTQTDRDGRWVFKKPPPDGWLGVVAEADGYVPRMLGSDKFDNQPRWQHYSGGLAKPATVTGRVTDETGAPLADVEVRIHSITTSNGEGYYSPRDESLKTGADGRFRVDGLPVGRATVGLSKPGYIRPWQPIALPIADIELRMVRAGNILVTVDFTGKARPKEYLVEMETEGFNGVGSYGGVGTLNDKNQFIFKNVPPGRYVLHGRPNPCNESQRTERVTIELHGGKGAEVKLNAR
jgi:hypothetical protein